jgi:hypothetical protein
MTGKSKRMASNFLTDVKKSLGTHRKNRSEEEDRIADNIHSATLGTDATSQTLPFYSEENTIRIV